MPGMLSLTPVQKDQPTATKLMGLNVFVYLLMSKENFDPPALSVITIVIIYI